MPVITTHIPAYFNRTCYANIPEHWRAECSETGFYRDSFISGTDAEQQLREYIALRRRAA